MIIEKIAKCESGVHNLTLILVNIKMPFNYVLENFDGSASRKRFQKMMIFNRLTSLPFPKTKVHISIGYWEVPLKNKLQNQSVF